jgi:plastocyanin
LAPASGWFSPILSTAAIALIVFPLAGQSMLEHSANISAGWVAPRGTLEFELTHRFEASPAPERKVTSFPSFVLAAGLPAHLTLGAFYTTNSVVVPRYPNEWELFGRMAPLRQQDGAPLDLGIEGGYNLAAHGPVGELSLARWAGPVRIVAAGRLLKDPGGGKADAVLAGGLVLRLGRWVALAGDVASLTHLAPGERVAWSAGLALGLPHTPHTLSIHASNAAGTGLEAASRGTGHTLYGFGFSIPFTLSRYVGGRPARAAAGRTAVPDSGVVVVHIRNLAFGTGELTVPAGTTLVWINDDQVAHTVVATDGSFDSGLFEPGANWQLRFTAPGSYSYSCTPHPFMHGTITVVAQ